MYEVIAIKEGYSYENGNGMMKAGASITLLKGNKNILVDSGSPWDTDILLEGLKKNGLSVTDINYVIGTHGHSDHVGNMNLFKEAIHILGHDICCRDQYSLHSFDTSPFEIDEHVEVIATPGHTHHCVSVVVRNTELGTVVVTGDLFEKEEDLDDHELWQSSSEYPEIQQKNRIDVINMADFIIPGHGKMFRIKPDFKRETSFTMMDPDL